MSDENDDICGSTDTSSGDPCERDAGWGIPGAENGPCSTHRVAGADMGPPGNDHAVGNDGGAPAGNGNAITHAATATPVNLFDHLEDHEREWVERIHAGYLKEATFGKESSKSERLLMACVMMYQEWSAREVILSDGISEDTIVGVNDEGEPIIDTEEHHLTRTASQLTGDVRMLLKDLGLLDDPESAKADAMDGLSDGARLVFAGEDIDTDE